MPMTAGFTKYESTTPVVNPPTSLLDAGTSIGVLLLPLYLGLPVGLELAFICRRDRANPEDGVRT